MSHIFAGHIAHIKSSKYFNRVATDATTFMDFSGLRSTAEPSRHRITFTVLIPSCSLRFMIVYVLSHDGPSATGSTPQSTRKTISTSLAHTACAGSSATEALLLD